MVAGDERVEAVAAQRTIRRFAADTGRHDIRGHELSYYLDELRRTREVTLAALRARDDAWFEAPLRIAPGLNAHWAWFHVAEDEINHRGQIPWLRTRLPHSLRTESR